MIPLSAANLTAYSAQVLVVIAAAAAGAAMIRLPLARARLMYWRLALASALLVPVLFVERTIVLVPVGVEIVASAVDVSLGDTLDEARRPVGLWPSDPTAIGAVLVVGTVLRLAWVGLGLLGLARLRRTSDAASLGYELEQLRIDLAPAAAVRWHDGIGQPVAFGWRRPLVLLPRRLATLPLDAQRAVLCHELLHVRRRDWLWTIGEEALRAAFWFHPAVWFALAQLQLAREQLVDEEVVRITTVRHPYMQALVAFATAPEPARALPFIRRRHLVSRIRELSEEHAMTHLRFASGVVTLAAVLAGSGWGAASALPLRDEAVTILPVPHAGAAPPAALPEIDAAREPVIETRRPSNQEPGTAQARQLSEAATKLEEAQARLKVAETLRQLEAASRAHRQAMEEARAADVAAQFGPPLVVHRVNPVFPEGAKGHGVEAVVTLKVSVGPAGEVTGVEVVRTRLTTEHDVTDPGFWASQPSRVFAQAAEDAVRQWRFEGTGSARTQEVSIGFREQPASVARRLRVGGMVREPVAVSKAPPAYPAAAKAAGVQGVVILEAVIGTDGSVQDARVLRSVPLLDKAALDAVRQWTYVPTLLNGAPVEVIVTLTVNFTLP